MSTESWRREEKIVVKEKPASEEKKTELLEMNGIHAEIAMIAELNAQVQAIDAEVSECKKILEHGQLEGEILDEWVEKFTSLVGREETEDKSHHRVGGLKEFEIFKKSAIMEVYGQKIKHDIKNIQTRFIIFQLLRKDLEDGDIKNFVEEWNVAKAYSGAYYYVMLDYATRAKDVLTGGKGNIIDRQFVAKNEHDGDVSEMLETLLGYIRVSASNHKTVHVHYPVHIPEKLYARIAPGVMFNKLNNVILNPVRKTESLKASNIWIAVDVKETEGTRNAVITIQDDGIGISEEVREHIFEGGYSTTKGKGIGLAYADTLFNQMGCSIEVASIPAPDRPGNGEVHTTFTITIPLSS